MTYTPTTWVDGPTGGTPITAARLNNIEGGIVSAAPGTPTEADYIVTVSGSTYTATPRNALLTTYTGTNFTTVLQNAITALTPSGSNGSGGGKIHITRGSYTLGNQIVITGWEGITGASSNPHSQLIIEGEGFATQLSQNTSGQHAFVVKNCANFVMRDLQITCGSSALACLFGDKTGATSEMSCWKSVIDNVDFEAASSSWPAVYLKNFFFLTIPHMWATNPNNHAVVLESDSALGINYGNSYFGDLWLIGSTSSPFAGLVLRSTTNGQVLDMNYFANVQTNDGGYYGIYCKGAWWNTFGKVDLEANTVGVFFDAGTSTFPTRHNKILAGYILPAASGTGIQQAGFTEDNTIDAYIDTGNGSVTPVSDATTFGAANTYNLGMLLNADLTAAIAGISTPPRHRINIVTTQGNTYTNLLSGTTTVTPATTDNSTNVATTAFVNRFATSKDSLTYNVLDHGVLADGSTDNTTALAALVTTVVAAGGGTILFPPSTSLYLGSLVVNANVSIKILGYGATLLGPSAGTALTIDTGQTGASGRTVIVEGLTIEGNADQTTDGVLVKDTSRARIVNCQIVRTNNGVKIQNNASGQNSEGTTIRSTLINDCVTGVLMNIVSGGPSFAETVFNDVGINNCTTGIYLPTTSTHVRSCFDATVWVGRTGSTNGVVMYTDADMTHAWGRLGGELYFAATSAAGVMVGPNASNFALCDLQLHIEGSVNPNVDVTTSGGSASWREGLAHLGQSNGSPATNMVGPHLKNNGDAYPRMGFSLGSPNNAPMPAGRDGLFFGTGGAQADTTLFRAGAHILEQGYGDVFLTGQAATGSRPSASAAGQGAQFFDTTLNKPIWSDGTNWHDVKTFADTVVPIGNTGTAKTISLTSGTVQTATLTGNCTFTMPAVAAGMSFKLLLNTGAGSFTAVFTGAKWPGGTAPTITVTAARLDILTFTSDGTDWYGSFAQNYTP